MKIKCLLFIFILSLILHFNVFAQTKNSGPITINSDKATFLREKKLIIFSGNVKVKKENLTINCDVLNVYLKDINKKNEKKQEDTKETIKKMIAKGNVHIFFEGKEGSCETSKYDVENKKIILLNNVTLIQGKNKITGDKLIIDLTTGESEVFSSKEDRVEIIFYPDNSTSKQQYESNNTY